MVQARYIAMGLFVGCTGDPAPDTDATTTAVAPPPVPTVRLQCPGNRTPIEGQFPARSEAWGALPTCNPPSDEVFASEFPSSDLPAGYLGPMQAGHSHAWCETRGPQRYEARWQVGTEVAWVRGRLDGDKPVEVWTGYTLRDDREEVWVQGVFGNDGKARGTWTWDCSRVGDALCLCGAQAIDGGFTDGRRNGLWTWSGPGDRRLSVRYAAGELDGEVRIEDGDGCVMRGAMKAGKRDGRWLKTCLGVEVIRQTWADGELQEEKVQDASQSG